jgi:septal ring-binding cell division protein DamX
MKVINRSRRRMENKHTLLMLFLVLFALSSFILGMIIGWGRGDKTAPTPPVATPAPIPAPAPIILPAAKELTFYDTLPKGEQVPLGSGINLPREGLGQRSADAGSTLAVVPPAPIPTGKVDTKVAAALSAPEPTSAASAPPAAKTEAPAPVKKEKWVVQVASYKAAEEARQLRERLSHKGFNAVVREADLGEKGKWYRIVLGPYPSATEAGQMAGRVQSVEKVTCLIRKD